MAAGVKMALRVVALAVTLTVVTAAVSVSEVTDPKHPGTCYVQRLKVRVHDGTTLDLPDCGGANCYRSGDQMFLKYYSCGLATAFEDGVECPKRQDLSLSYPECCPTPVCPSDNQ